MTVHCEYLRLPIKSRFHSLPSFRRAVTQIITEAQSFRTPTNHIKILGAGRMTRSKCCIRNPQILKRHRMKSSRHGNQTPGIDTPLLLLLLLLLPPPPTSMMMMMTMMMMI